MRKEVSKLAQEWVFKPRQPRVPIPHPNQGHTVTVTGGRMWCLEGGRSQRSWLGVWALSKGTGASLGGSDSKESAQCRRPRCNSGHDDLQEGNDKPL